VLRLSGTDINPGTGEVDVKEVVGDVVVTVKKCIIEEDQLLINGYINCGTNPTVLTDKKRSSFLDKVAAYFNEHYP